MITPVILYNEEYTRMVILHVRHVSLAAGWLTENDPGTVVVDPSRVPDPGLRQAYHWG